MNRWAWQQVYIVFLLIVGACVTAYSLNSILDALVIIAEKASK